MVRMTYMEASAIIAFVGNDQVPSASAISLCDFLGDIYAAICLLVVAAAHGWIVPIADNWHWLCPHMYW